MAGFDSIQKRLNIQPARVITDAERASANVPLTKYATIKASRALGKIPTTLTIPAFVLNVLPPGVALGFYRMAWQFNVTFPHYFSILTCNNIGSTLAGFLTVKFTVNGAVYRYIIAGDYNNLIQGTKIRIAPFPAYAGELIFPNCCFEFWYIKTGVLPSTGIVSPIKITTSLLSVPATADILEIIVDPGAQLNIADLGFSPNENLPMQQANIRWLDN